MKSTLFPALALLASTPLCAAATAPVAPPAELPVETFFQSATISNLEFSPDGKRILCLVPYQHRQNVAVIDLVKGSKNLLSSFDDREATGAFWANDGRILFLVDDEGKEEFTIYAVDPDGKDPSKFALERSADFLRRLKDEPRHILVKAAITNRDWWDVAKLDLKTGKLGAVVAKAPGNVDYYVLDHANVVRFAVVRDLPTRTNRVLYREANGQEWRELERTAFDSPGWEPVAFDGDNRTIFVRSNLGRKTNAICRYDTGAGAIRLETVVADDTYDVTHVVYDESKRRVVGVAYEGDRRRFHWLDPEMAAIQRKLEATLPDAVHYPIQFSTDGSKIIYFSYSDRDPGVYYLYDRERQKLDELAVVTPQIDPALMAPVKPVSYTARDGLVLHGYLTLPLGREPRNLPVIIHPHGGPYGPRDHWAYDPEVQFYANRGFAVLQVDYRGSGGYGDWFQSAGYKKWGLEMQDDLTDGVKWLVAQGFADPARVVISGASYGGYATMAGLTFTPELYCAGINYVGVVDIRNLIPRTPTERDLYGYNTQIGSLADAADRQRFHDTSPVHFADRIRVPLLMAYGRNDPRVPIDQAYDIERALKSAGVPYELIIKDKEGHGFRFEEDRIAFYRRVDAFLKKHVPAPAPPRN